MTLIKPRLKLSHNVIRVSDDKVCIGEIPGHSYSLEGVGPEFLELLDFLDGKCTVPRIIRGFQQRHPEVSDQDVLDAIQDLTDRNLLEDGAAESTILSTAEMELYDRQILMYSIFAESETPGFSYQEALKSKRVCVLGMGGWGTWLVQHLALNGIGYIRIIDGDDVELSNLNRQILYRHGDIGKSKVTVAKAQVATMNPHVEIDAIPIFVPKDAAKIAELLDGVDAVFLCWASLGYYLDGTAEEILHRICFEKKLPIFEMAADPFDVSIGPIYVNDRQDPCYLCNHEEIRRSVIGDDTSNALINEARLARRFHNGTRVVNAWQTSPSLSVMAGIVADQALKFLAGLERPHLCDKKFSLNLRDFSSRTESFSRKPYCAWCGLEAHL